MTSARINIGWLGRAEFRGEGGVKEKRRKPIAWKTSLHLQGNLRANVVQAGATWELFSI